MPIQARLALVIDFNEFTVSQVGTIDVAALPRAGEFIYHHNGMRAPYETVYKVVGVIHEVNVGASTSLPEVLVTEISKLELRAMMAQNR